MSTTYQFDKYYLKNKEIKQGANMFLPRCNNLHYSKRLEKGDIWESISFLFLFNILKLCNIYVHILLLQTKNIVN